MLQTVLLNKPILGIEAPAFPINETQEGFQLNKASPASQFR